VGFAFFVFFAVFGLLTLGQWLTLREKSPQQKKALYPRYTALNGLVFTAMMSLIIVAAGDYGGLLLLLPIAAVLVYLSVTKIRVCECCGNVVQPQNLISPALHCPRCGTGLSADPWVVKYWSRRL
jgi:cell division protein FtsW (lipid II flippase)